MENRLPIVGNNYEKSVDWRMHRSTFLIKLLNNIRGKEISNDEQILDVGCGPDCIANYLWNKVCDPEYVLGIDIQNYSLEEFLRFGNKREFLHQDIFDWQPILGKFDIVFSSSSMNWMLGGSEEKEVDFYTKMLDSLKPGGFFVATTPASQNFTPVFTTLLLRAFREIGHEFSDKQKYLAHRKKHVWMPSKVKNIKDVPVDLLGFNEVLVSRSFEWDSWNRDSIVDMWMSAGQSIFQDVCDMTLLERKLREIVDDDAKMHELKIKILDKDDQEYIHAPTSYFYIIFQKDVSSDLKLSAKCQFPKINRSIDFETYNAIKDISSLSLGEYSQREVWLSDIEKIKLNKNAPESVCLSFLPIAKELGDQFIYAFYLIQNYPDYTYLKSSIDNKYWFSLLSDKYKLSISWMHKFKDTQFITFTSLLAGVSDILMASSIVINQSDEIAKHICNNKFTAKELAIMWVVSDPVRDEKSYPPIDEVDYLRFLDNREKISVFCMNDTVINIFDKLFSEDLENLDPCGIDLFRYFRWQVTVNHQSTFIQTLYSVNVEKYSASVYVNDCLSVADIYTIAYTLQNLFIVKDLLEKSQVIKDKHDRDYSHEISSINTFSQNILNFILPRKDFTNEEKLLVNLVKVGLEYSYLWANQQSDDNADLDIDLIIKECKRIAFIRKYHVASAEDLVKNYHDLMIFLRKRINVICISQLPKNYRDNIYIVKGIKAALVNSIYHALPSKNLGDVLIENDHYSVGILISPDKMSIYNSGEYKHKIGGTKDTISSQMGKVNRKGVYVDITNISRKDDLENVEVAELIHNEKIAFPIVKTYICFGTA